ncbi:hypothetical protein [Bradyrhizobium sp. Leo170]|uniref:hypothetical protein n=1 Tax=Bradyrhizobium sp. Leo170 TaxID=1571199 RepID=UPI00102EBDDF|nr:hypothetical protein [Bradyrhizobium sp. Leo170]TAI67614.1 hypothetical protein CWO89_02010 [Bradyrhizobium sp. Leo170]
MLIAEESFDAMLQMLIDGGLVPKSCAAVMLDRLSARLLSAMTVGSNSRSNAGSRGPTTIGVTRPA